MGLANGNIAKLFAIGIMLIVGVANAAPALEQTVQTDRSLCVNLVLRLDTNKIATLLKVESVTVRHNSPTTQLACSLVVKSGWSYINKDNTVNIFIYKTRNAYKVFSDIKEQNMSKRFVRELMLKGQPWWQSFFWMRDSYYDYVDNRQEFHFYTEAGDYLLFSFTEPVPKKTDKEAENEQNWRFSGFIKFVVQTLYNLN